MKGFAVHFAEVPDPRADNARHDFLEVIVVALAALLCGAEDCTDMALFARAKLDLLRQVLKLEHGSPGHDTFSRVFRRIAPEPFEAAFARFTAAFSGGVAGGGSCRGSSQWTARRCAGAYERGRKTTPLHLVNVWAAKPRPDAQSRPQPPPPKLRQNSDKGKNQTRRMEQYLLLSPLSHMQ